MHSKYIVVLVLFGVAAFFVLFPGCISWFLKLCGMKPPGRTVLFASTIQLKWGGYFWEGPTRLTAWAGFQKRLGPYASVSGAESSVGEVQLSVSSPDAAVPSPPSGAQAKGFCYVRENDQAIQEKVLKAIFDAYPEWRETYKDSLGEEFETQMPVLQTPSDLKPLIGLSTIHILNVERDGLAYVGFEFGCEWEEEHGLGVMTLGNRIVDVGSAEEAFSASRANEDKSKANI